LPEGLPHRRIVEDADARHPPGVKRRGRRPRLRLEAGVVRYATCACALEITTPNTQAGAASARRKMSRRRYARA
jgi:hypothetical protein